MSGNKKKSEGEVPANPTSNSRFWKTLLTVLAAFLTFAGPTYMVYVFINILNVDYFLSMISGIVFFTIGLVIVWYIIKNKVIS